MSLLTASLDDLVFEGRNQAYGAYQLRRAYSIHLASAGGLTLGMCVLVLLGWLAWPAAHPPVVTTHPVKAEPILKPTIIEHPQVVKKQPPAAPARPAAAQPRPTTTRPAPTIPTQVAPDHLVPPPPKPLATELPTDLPAGPVTPGAPAGLAEAGVLGAAGGVPGGTGTAGSETAASNSAVDFVEKMPEFAGGQAALLRYLRDHLRYPSQALREGVEGRVFLSFVVGTNGTITEVKVLKGLGYGLDEEAMRVVRQMPAWTPGYQAHHAVPVRFTLPITFSIQ